MSLQAKQINPNIGAVIEGIDLNHADTPLLLEIKQALLQHQVIFFRKQALSHSRK